MDIVGGSCFRFFSMIATLVYVERGVHASRLAVDGDDTALRCQCCVGLTCVHVGFTTHNYWVCGLQCGPITLLLAALIANLSSSYNYLGATRFLFIPPK